MKTRKIKFMWLAVIILVAFVWLAPAASAQTLKPGEIIYSRAATVPGGNCDTGAVWAVGQDGSNDRFITPGFHPRISPDGRFLLFKRYHPSSLCSPFGIGARWWRRELATNRETQISENFTGSSGHFFSPETNRAGGQIIQSDGNGLCRMNIDGTNRVCGLVPNIDPIRGAGHPSVRGTDNLLLVQNFQDNADGGLYTLNYDNFQNRQKIPNTVGRDLNPSWSNDGQTIAFAVFPTGRGEPYFFTNLFKINADGSNRTQLTFFTQPFGEGFSYSLVWTLDNQTILNAAKINGVAGIYRIAADGSGNILGTIPITPGAAPEWVGGIVPAYSEQQVASFGGSLVSGDAFSLIGTFGQGFAGQTSLGDTYNFQSGFWHYPPSSAPSTNGILALSNTAFSVNENGATATITVTRSGGSDGAIGVSYATSDGTAAAGSDYTAANGTLNWNDGEGGSKTFTVSILDDTIVEGSETVNLTLSNATGGATLGSPSEAVLTILDNDIACTYSIAPTSHTIVGGSGDVSANVTTTSGCAWTAVSNSPWLTVTSGASGTGSGTVTFSAAANTTISARTGTLTIAGQTLTVTQPVGNGTCAFTIAPISQTINGNGGSANATVTTANSCAWTAVSNAPWLTIMSGASGSGSGTVTYSAAANTTAAVRTGTLTIAGQTLTVTQPVGAGGGTIDVSIPTNLIAPQNTVLTVPVNVSDTTGSNVTSFDFRLNYDPAVFTPAAAAVETNGTLSSGFEVNVNSASAGTLIVSGFGTAPLAGAGVLLNFKFDAVGAFSSCSALGLTNFGFNEGNPAATTADGQACITGASVSGAVNYGSAAAATGVPGVILNAAGTPAVSPATTDAAGNYVLSGFGSGAYTVTPSKTGGANNAITSFDASQISKHLVQIITLTPAQLAAADVSGNGSVTSFDASLIAQTVLGIPNAGNAGTWRFSPVNRNYLNINANQTGHNYTAILMGEVSGNWTPPAPLTNNFGNNEAIPERVSADAVQVSLPVRNVGVNSDFTMPVFVGDVTGREISSFDFEVLYDSSVIAPQTQAAANVGTMSSGFAVGTNIITPGRLRVSGYGAANLAGSGTLLYLNFRTVGALGSNSSLNWNGFLFNEGEPAANRLNGQINVSSQVASTQFDFEGDGRADVSVFRPSDGVWYVNRSSNGFTALKFGISNDKIVPADYDGDGKTDIAVWRENEGNFYIFNSADNSIRIENFGLPGDIPTVGDWDGDGRADIAVYRGSAGYFYYRGSLDNPSNNITYLRWGLAGDKPLAADYDGDGKFDVCVFRPSDRVWYIRRSSNDQFIAIQFGFSTDKLVPADYDGDGKTDIAVYRDGIWWISRSGDGGYTIFNFGLPDDQPVPADYDGDGRADIAVYRGGVWYIAQTSNAQIAFRHFGLANDMPIPNAYVP